MRERPVLRALKETFGACCWLVRVLLVSTVLLVMRCGLVDGDAVHGQRLGDRLEVGPSAAAAVATATSGQAQCLAAIE